MLCERTASLRNLCAEAFRINLLRLPGRTGHAGQGAGMNGKNAAEQWNIMGIYMIFIPFLS